MAYKILKKVIESGIYNCADIMDKLDAYYAFGRITTEQYNELMAALTAAK